MRLTARKNLLNIKKIKVTHNPTPSDNHYYNFYVFCASIF